uniref:Uncharacterized protein n=1 Tax=Arundo donax TaxID=35708 RepID=A0A0A9F0E7_ARUDO
MGMGSSFDVVLTWNRPFWRLLNTLLCNAALFIPDVPSSRNENSVSFPADLFSGKVRRKIVPFKPTRERIDSLNSALISSAMNNSGAVISAFLVTNKFSSGVPAATFGGCPLVASSSRPVMVLSL